MIHVLVSLKFISFLSTSNLGQYDVFHRLVFVATVPAFACLGFVNFTNTLSQTIVFAY